MKIQIRRWKHQNAYSHFLGWLQGFAELADGLVTVLSFATLSSNFEIRVSFYRAFEAINRSKNDRERFKS